MKITIYELLGLVKDGKVPKIIKYNEKIWEYSEKGENYFIGDNTSINWDYIVINCLNEPVEILEEEKKIPEKLGINDINTISLVVKVNEIIDYLKSKGDE